MHLLIKLGLTVRLKRNKERNRNMTDLRCNSYYMRFGIKLCLRFRLERNKERIRKISGFPGIAFRYHINNSGIFLTAIQFLFVQD